MRIKYKTTIVFLLLSFLANSTSWADQKSYEQILKTAEQGDANAQNTIGLSYFSNKKDKDNIKKAFKWFAKSAEQNHPAALFNLASLYQSGQGTEQNTKKAKELFEKSASLGNREALYVVGTMHQAKGEFDKAAIFIKMSAEKGYLEAQNRFGYFYSEGLGVPRNDNIAHYWYLKAAKGGLAKAQYNVAQDYYLGLGVEKNENTALLWYKKSAKGGFKQSQEILTKLASEKPSKKLENQQILKSDINKPANKNQAMNSTEAFVQNKKNAEAGDMNAQYELGQAYLKMGNEKEGVKWIERAAAKGHPKALDLTSINSDYHEANAYIKRLNEERRKKNK